MPINTTNGRWIRLAASCLFLLLPFAAVARSSEDCPASTENALRDAGGLWTTLSADGVLGMQATHEGLGPGLVIDGYETLFQATLWESNLCAFYDWGPGTPFPDGSDGTPNGDANKYRLLSDWAADGPDPDLLAVSDPRGVRFLFSFREPDLVPEEKRVVVFAIAAAQVWHGHTFSTEGLEETILTARDFLELLPASGDSQLPAMVGHTSHLTVPVLGD